ncbi:MAG: hypothetical protein WDN28_13575 [Chthoniobacter sp.]
MFEKIKAFQEENGAFGWTGLLLGSEAGRLLLEIEIGDPNKVLGQAAVNILDDLHPVGLFLDRIQVGLRGILLGFDVALA